MLRGKTYVDGDIILIIDIGEGDDALLCLTDRADCCSNPNGEFYYPSGSAVGYSSTNSLYRNRGSQVVRLNRRDNTLSPVGRYRCEIPDSSGTTQRIYINILCKFQPCMHLLFVLGIIIIAYIIHFLNKASIGECQWLGVYGSTYAFHHQPC